MPAPRDVREDEVVDPAVEQVVEQVVDLHGALAAAARRDDLRPGPASNALFSRLVTLAVERRPAAEAARVLAAPDVAAVLGDLHRLCAAGEQELERHWAARVARAPVPRDELARFPYTGNYHELARMEVHALRGQLERPVRRVLFVGSGPMPLSAVAMAEGFGVAVDNLDVDPESVAMGRAVVEALDVAGVGFGVGDVLGTTDLTGYDAVFLAALVGLDPAAKADVLRHLRRVVGDGAVLLARSAHGLRRLLYPELDLDHGLITAGFVPLAVLHPYTDVVNSVVLARAG